MKKVTIYVCDNNHRHATAKEAKYCEKLEAEQKKFDAFSESESKLGKDTWVTNGKIFSAPIVDPEKFGPHDYGDGQGNCWCGCSMGSFYSSGPVNPFGMCPKNPLSSTEEDCKEYSNRTNQLDKGR